jgi:TonB-linked SusC/RagA family outer membrane protein
MTRLARLAAFSLVAAALVGRGADAQQGTGTVTGHVTDADARRPVPIVQVVVVGTTIGTRTDATGAYRLVNVPAGMATIRYSLIGYRGDTRQVAVTAGGTTTQDVSLASAPTILAQVVTTASGTEQRRRENGASVATVKADSLPKAAIQNFSEILTGRTPGVTVSQSSGTTGMGARVRIRGANSVSLSNEPLLIIDGVRIDNNPESNSIGVGGQSPSRLNDINPEDIESFDVIKGPAAAALYGTAAANGVIQITTKRGRAGRSVWNAIGEVGSVQEHNKYPPNYGGWTKTPANTPTFPFPGFRDATKPAPTCNLFLEAYAVCTTDSLSTFNTLVAHSPFRTGRRQKVGGNVAGGTSAMTYYLGSDVEKESGVYETSNLDRMSFRGNLTTHPAESVDLNISTGFVRSDLQLPQNDNNYYGAISNGLAGWPGDGPSQGYNPFAPSLFNQIDTRQELNRFTGGANGTWRILPWLSANATVGLDNLGRFDSQTLQPNVIRFGNDFLGSRFSNRFNVTNVTTNYALTARRDLTAEIGSVTQVGYQYQQAQSRGTYARGYSLTAGTGSLGGVNSDIKVNEITVDNKTAGGFVSEQISWRDKLFITGTLRADKNSAFGRNFGTIKYPAVSASYVVAEDRDWLSQFRIRAALGESGLRPGVLDAIAYSNPVAARLDSTDRAAITAGNIPNDSLRAERTRETELGFDAGFFGDRATVEFTYYNKRSRDALILRPLPVSLGGPSTQFVNLGSVTNRGFELTVGASPLRRENVELGLTVTASNNRNRLESLGGVPPIVFGLNSAQRHVEGYALGGYWGTQVDSIHLNANGTLHPDSVFFSLDESKVRFLGSPLPTRQGSFTADLTLMKMFHLGSMFEYRGGNKLYNASEQFRCIPFVATCRGLVDKTAPIPDQANAFADAVSQGSFFGGYIEDASFVKWRELTVGVSIPSRYLTALRATDGVLTFGARNLKTWTDYSGLDPEVNFDGQANFSTGDFLTQPQVRYYTVRLNLTF